jgi:SAM-dependent methyltransferase
MFTFGQAYLAKYEFDRLRKNQKLLFDYQYNITESILKYYYIVQQILKFQQAKPQDIIVLDLGCGNGHLSKIIVQLTGAVCYGFDPRISVKVKLNTLKFNLQNILAKRPGRIKLYKMDHLNFFEKNSLKFDVVIDSCSVTHFNTNKFNNINEGWMETLKFLDVALKFDGVFISATDVTLPDECSTEFLQETHLLDCMNKDWVISDKDFIADNSEFNNKTADLNFIEELFIRISPPGTVKTSLLGILGFQASKRF